MTLFFVVATFVLGLLWTYVGWSLILPLLWSTPYLWLGCAFLVGTFAMQIWRFTQIRNSEQSPRWVLVTYFSLGLMCHLLVAGLIKDFINLFLVVTPPLILVFILASLLLNILSFLIARQGPRVVRVPIRTKIPGGPLKMVQFSDLHVGPMITRKYVENVVRLIRELKPDLIVATGDIGDGPALQLAHDLEPLAHLQSLAPCFYIPGNHEYYWDVQEWMRAMGDLGFQTLLNRGMELDLPEKIPLWLGGVPDPQGERFIPAHRSDPLQAMDLAKSTGRYKILLAHQPKSYLDAFKAKFDLMVCGHTHGGQFFPFTLIVGFFNPFTRGLNFYNSLKIYVNVGTGFWGPPLRLGAPAEITCFELS